MSAPPGLRTAGVVRVLARADGPPDGAPRTTRRDVVAGLLTALAVAVLGPPAGLAWAALAPRERVVVDPGGAVAFAEAGGDLFVGADLAFVLVTGLLGLACGAVAYAVAGRRGWPVAVALAGAGLLASATAVAVGEAVATGPLAYEGGRLVPPGGPVEGAAPPAAVLGLGEAGGSAELALGLRATAAVVLWPLVAVLTHLVLQLVRPAERDQIVTGTPPAPPVRSSTR